MITRSLGCFPYSESFTALLFVNRDLRKKECRMGLNRRTEDGQMSLSDYTHRLMRERPVRSTNLPDSSATNFTAQQEQKRRPNLVRLGRERPRQVKHH